MNCKMLFIQDKLKEVQEKQLEAIKEQCKHYVSVTPAYQEFSWWGGQQWQGPSRAADLTLSDDDFCKFTNI